MRPPRGQLPDPREGGAGPGGVSQLPRRRPHVEPAGGVGSRHCATLPSRVLHGVAASHLSRVAASRSLNQLKSFGGPTNLRARARAEEEGTRYPRWRDRRRRRRAGGGPPPRRSGGRLKGACLHAHARTRARVERRLGQARVWTRPHGPVTDRSRTVHGPVTDRSRTVQSKPWLIHGR